MHAHVEHRLLADIQQSYCHLYFCISLDMYVDKSAVGRPGQTMRLNPNKPSSRKSSPVPEKLHGLRRAATR